MSKLSLIAALALGGLMACSTLVTAADTAADTTTPPAKKGGKNRPTVEQQVTRMTDTLTLTDEQKPKVKAVLEATSKAMQEIRNDTSLDQQARRDKMQPIMDKQNTAMKAILTPEQNTKYLEMNARKGKKKTQ
jgi:periplasmic protein CpxP/Spy